MEKSDFMKYLGAVCDLEGIVYIHRQAIKELRWEYTSVSKRIKNNNYEKLYSHSGSTDVAPISQSACVMKGFLLGLAFAVIFCICAVIFGPILATVFNGFSVSTDEVVSTTSTLIMIALIIAIVIGVVSGKNMYDQYKDGSDEWRKIEDDNKKIKESNKKKKKEDSIKINFISQEIKMLETNLYEVERLLNDYYGKGILHKDYQNLIAVCSIYQYFDSGRCSELTSANGAYNLYEDDKFKRTIISKLDEVISKLDQIQRTQSQLYQVMCECQSQIYTLTSAIDHMNENLSSIKQSVEIIEYNSKYMKQNEQYRVLLRGY